MVLVYISCIFGKALGLATEDGLVDLEGIAYDRNQTASQLVSYH